MNGVRSFSKAAGRYWLSVFPKVCREIRLWRSRAEQIPDPVLRELALRAQRLEQGNLEGAAAFAVLAPPTQHSYVVRAAVTFQLLYDYIDALAEQPSADPVSNGRQLHQALLTALDPDARHPDYYAHHSSESDGGYIEDLANTCRAALAALPSYTSVAEPALRAARRMVTYQSLNHHGSSGSYGPLAEWAAGQTPGGAELLWWETAAGTASSLSVFALIAQGANPASTEAEVDLIAGAYFPWIGALHVLLDSLVDLSEDLSDGQHSLIDHYTSQQETATRLGLIATAAVAATEELLDGAQHALILSAMTSYYLSAPQASGPTARHTARLTLEPMGSLAAPAMLMLRARRAASQLAARALANG